QFCARQISCTSPSAAGLECPRSSSGKNESSLSPHREKFHRFLPTSETQFSSSSCRYHRQGPAPAFLPDVACVPFWLDGLSPKLCEVVAPTPCRTIPAQT